MNQFNNYNLLYPELVIELLDYFKLDGNINAKSVLDFCQIFSNNRGVSNPILIQPETIARMCEILHSKGKLSRIRHDGNMGFNNNYTFVIKDDALWNTHKKLFSHYYNSLIYGVEYIYSIYKGLVLPIINTNEYGDQSMGSCFYYRTGILTAKHCLETNGTIAIQGLSVDKLKTAKIYISNNPYLDVAYIDIQNHSLLQTIPCTPNVLDSVLVMGYPNVAGFLNFLTAETATISSIASKRFAATTGNIAAIATEMFSKVDLMLITAKIKGGNSGGPIINEYGSPVGIAVSQPFSEGNYDDLGYGVGVPLSYFDQVITENRYFENINFVNFPD